MSGKHYVVGDSSPFLKRVLIPFWVVRILVLLIQAVVLGLAIAALAAFREDIQNEVDISYGATVAIFVVNLIIVLFCLALDLVSIIKRASRTLSPRFFIITNVIQTTIWTVLFILSFIGSISTTGIIISVIVYLSFVGMLIYASVVYHRFRTGRLTYARAGQIDPTAAQNPGFTPYGNYGQGPSNAAYRPAEFNGYKQPEYELPTQYGYGQQSTTSAWQQNQAQYPPPGQQPQQQQNLYH
ncbi:hypothetical protein SODALDRAFT_332119 [Sodiomyces alkalinus F11]|uniref:Uncharacterized protein n=1 Tax=Sodiomyces alkalinus (strain CBS 110278 / VKM F-3762 / F11) TaxID=1314773 RepID=A0A3N2PZM0_SODAK|nr:hypothetical protein SODALDRAFT_332119 [Sodiomyces alkalinus F11]ROT39970.1 hypothetical protein SODALDRAFT_332119 [Sodiomyces alkalinus F11]